MNPKFVPNKDDKAQVKKQTQQGYENHIPFQTHQINVEMQYVVLNKPLKELTNRNPFREITNVTAKQHVLISFDPQKVIPYQEEIRMSMEKQTATNRLFVNKDLMANHVWLTEKIRTYLIEKIINLCSEQKQLKRTMFFACYMLDVHLSHAPNPDFVQIIPYTCLFMASKYEEIYPPQPWMYIPDSEMRRVILQEAQLLEQVDYRLIVVSSHTWLHYFWALIKHSDKVVLEVAQIQIETALYDSLFLKYSPQMIASTALQLGFKIAGYTINWNQIALQAGLHLDHEIHELSIMMALSFRQSQAKNLTLATLNLHDVDKYF